MTTMTTIT
ncbi:Protein of unknown function [Bacillus toyonensis]|nr:Protein of unknown function [Bacillus toyonensis]